MSTSIGFFCRLMSPFYITEINSAVDIVPLKTIRSHSLGKHHANVFKHADHTVEAGHTPRARQGKIQHEPGRTF